MTLRTIRFTGQIRLETPAAITIHGTTINGEPTPVPTTTIALPDGTLVETGYIPSTSLRGGIRRAAVADLYERRQQAGLPSPLDLRTYYMLAIGGTRSRGSASVTHDADREPEVRTRNPIVSTFGAADTGDHYFLGAKLGITHLIPHQPIDPKKCAAYPSVRVDDLLRSPDKVLPMLADGAASAWSELFKRTSQTSALKKQAKSLKTEAAKAKSSGDAAKRTEVNAQLREIDQALETGDLSTQLLVPGYRGLPEGLHLRCNFTFHNPTDIELGIFLSALERFSFDPFVGGHRAHGCGEISGRWEVTTQSPRGPRETLGQVAFGPGGFEISESPVFTAAAVAWNDASLTADFAYKAAAVAGMADDDAE